MAQQNCMRSPRLGSSGVLLVRDCKDVDVVDLAFLVCLQNRKAFFILWWHEVHAKCAGTQSGGVGAILA